MKNTLPSKSTFFSSGQREAYAYLWQIADLYFNSDFRKITAGAVSPRLTPLIVAQSGCGKTHIVKMLARDMELAYIRLHPGNWVVNGVRDLTPTLTKVERLVEDHKSVLIHLDELDKWRAGVTSDWGFFGRIELFDLIDRYSSQLFRNGDWRDSVLIVGSATFQDLWNDALRAKVGFGTQDSSSAIVAKVKRQIEVSGIVPDEVRLRFRSPHVIPPPSPEDFREACSRMGISKLAERIGAPPLDFELAARSCSGARWLEEVLGELLLLAQQITPDLLGRRDRTPETSPEELDEEFPDFGEDGDDEQVLG